MLSLRGFWNKKKFFLQVSTVQITISFRGLTFEEKIAANEHVLIVLWLGCIYVAFGRCHKGKQLEQIFYFENF